jgi:hypothetical protein
MDRFCAEKVKNCNRYALLSGDRKEIVQLYSEGKYHFSWAERMIYHAARYNVSRLLAKWIFELRYRINNRRAFMPRIHRKGRGAW